MTAKIHPGRDLAEKPMFRDLPKDRRGLVPARYDKGDNDSLAL